MARLLVNKHFTEHNGAINGFTSVEDYAFGEIIICNDSEKPSIYIKDADNNSVAISNIEVSENDSILSLEDNKLSARISMVWDSENDKIKLFGKTKDDVEIVLSEIEIFSDDKNGIGDKIDKAIERTVDVTLFSATEGNQPEGTEIGQDYLKVETISNGVTNQSYISFSTFTVEGGDNTDKSGEIVVEKDVENDKYIISHGEVDTKGETITSPTFGMTEFVSGISVNDLGHVTTISKGILPSVPGISVSSETPEDGTNLYVQEISKTDKMGITVTYANMPEMDIDVVTEESSDKALRFISSIDASGSIITGTTSEVNFDGYAKASDFENYYDKTTIDSKLENIIDPDGELIIPPVVITGDTTEEEKYIYDIKVNDNGEIEISTQELGLDNYVTKLSVSTSNTELNWGEETIIGKIDDKELKVTLPSKPGITVTTNEDTENSNMVIVGIGPSSGETTELTFTTREFDFDGVLESKDIAIPDETPTLSWEKSISIMEVNGSPVSIKMPNPIEVNVETTEDTEISKVVTEITTNEHGISVKSVPFSPKDYLVEDDLENYLDNNSITVVDAESDLTEENKFITSIATGITGNSVQFTLNYGKYDVDNDTEIGDAVQLEWGETSDLAKIGNKTISVALPENNVESVVDSKIVTYDLNLTQENDKVTINLTPTIGGETQEPDTTIIDLTKYINEEISLSLDENTTETTGNTFLKNISVNGTQITREFGEVGVNVESNQDTELEWDTAIEIAKVDGKSIYAKLPAEPEKGEGADGNTLYQLSGGKEGDIFKISLMSGTNGTTYEGESGSAELDLSSYLTSGDVSTYIPVKGVKVNDADVVNEDGIAQITLNEVSVQNNSTELQWGTSNVIGKVNDTELTVTMPAEPETVETNVDDVQINGTSIVSNKIANIAVSQTNTSLAWGTEVELAKIGNVSISAALPTKPAAESGVTDTTYSLSGQTSDSEFKVTLTGSDGTTGNAVLTFSEMPFISEETSITTGSTTTGGFVKNITFSGDKNHEVNVEYGDPDLSEYAKIGDIPEAYTLPMATENLLGGVKVGNFLGMDNGTMSVITGTTAVSVAVGNHAHDGVYLKIGDFTDSATTIEGHYTPSTTSTSYGENGSYISGISLDSKNHVITATTALLPTTATTAKSLENNVNVGNVTTPVYFLNGNPTVCELNYLTDTDITQNYLTNKIGNYYLTAETYKGTVTDAKTVVSNTNAGTGNTTTTDGATYLNTVLTNNGNTSVVSSHKIVGEGSVNISSDADGVITISGAEYQPIGNYLTKETYKGTISGITVGSGLTGGGSAETDAIGVTIKPNLNNYNSLGTIGNTSKLYAVGIDANNELCVNVPWVEEKNNGTVTSVELNTGSTYVALTGSTITNSGTYTIDLSEETKTKIDNGSAAYGWGNHARAGYYKEVAATTGTAGTVQLREGDLSEITATTAGQAASSYHTHSQYLTSAALNDYATTKYVDNTFSKNEHDHDGVYKPRQTAVSDPSASNSGTTFIATISQDVNGVITATKQNVDFSNYQPKGDYKTTQTEVSDPSASGNATAFIDTISQDTNGKITATKKNVDFSNYKTKQTAVSDPSASGSGATFIATISQDANGVITATKQNVDFSDYATISYVNGLNHTDEKVKSEVDEESKAYLLATTAESGATGTTVKSTSIYMSGGTMTASAFYQESDERLKDFVSEIEIDFDKLKEIPKSYFTWKSDEDKVMQIGTSAQKVKELYPELVGGTSDTLTVDYARLSMVALKAVDKLHEENEKLRNELDMIKKHLGL